MSFDELARAAHRVLGASLRSDAPGKLLRSHTLDGTLGESVSLVIRQAAAAGATEITLHRPDDLYLRGEVPAGIAVDVAGQERLVAHDAEASDGEITLTLDSPLDVAADPNAPVTLAPSAEFTFERSVRYSIRQDLIPQGFEGQISFVAYLPKADAPTEPRIGDLLIFGERRGTILGWLREDAGAWTALVGRTG